MPWPAARPANATLLTTLANAFAQGGWTERTRRLARPSSALVRALASISAWSKAVRMSVELARLGASRPCAGTYGLGAGIYCSIAGRSGIRAGTYGLGAGAD